MSVYPVVPLADQGALLAAFARNCICQFDDDSSRIGAPCVSCMVLTEEANLKRLVFGCRMARRLLVEEFRTQTEVAA